jgi:V8-like Glu-specific endopeptidase
MDTLPEFPFLTIGGAPSGTVRVIGFGGISAIPYKWTATGQVDCTCTRKYDGTPIFDVEFQNPAVPGNSGSPALNDQNQVVGLWTWHYYDMPTKGTAQQSSVLRDPCN